jgi:hypothetical protein
MGSFQARAGSDAIQFRLVPFVVIPSERIDEGSLFALRITAQRKMAGGAPPARVTPSGHCILSQTQPQTAVPAAATSSA